jgi:hypothetical protein
MANKKKQSEVKPEPKIELETIIETEQSVMKKPKSAYLLFCEVARPGLPECKPKEKLAKLGELWRQLKTVGGSEYQKYVDLAEKEKNLYDKFKQENPDLVAKKKKEKDSSEDGKKKKKKKETTDGDVADKPKKTNGYLKYLKAKRTDFKESNPKFTSQQITKELAAQWKQLSDNDKLLWKES